MTARGLLGLALALVLSSCAQAPGGLPPPGPPAPAPPQAPPGRPAPPPSVLVAVLRDENGRREPLAEETVQAVNILARRGYAARSVQIVESLPASIRSAAEKAAEGFKEEKADVLILGEITPGATVQVRMGSVDLRSGRFIADAGFQGPPAKLTEILDRTMTDILNAVERYRGAAPR